MSYIHTHHRHCDQIHFTKPPENKRSAEMLYRTRDFWVETRTGHIILTSNSSAYFAFKKCTKYVDVIRSQKQRHLIYRRGEESKYRLGFEMQTFTEKQNPPMPGLRNSTRPRCSLQPICAAAVHSEAEQVDGWWTDDYFSVFVMDGCATCIVGCGSKNY